MPQKVKKCSRKSKKNLFKKFLSWLTSASESRNWSDFPDTVTIKEIYFYKAYSFIGLLVAKDLEFYGIRNWRTIARAYSEIIFSLSPKYRLITDYTWLLKRVKKKIPIHSARDVYSQFVNFYELYLEGAIFYNGPKRVAELDVYHDYGIDLKLWGITKSRVMRILKKYNLKLKDLESEDVPEYVKTWVKTGLIKRH